jgi:adenine-specific DNA-methyltransferase
MSEGALDTLAGFLARHVPVASGWTSAGGLTKFEPTEMERLLVPDRPELNEGESSTEL